jgi:putative RecB family exonuclease
MTTETTAPAPLKTLSPSRASDFKQCPQMYKLKSIDRIPTAPNIHQARGTTAHLALERLFELDAPDRTPERLYELFRKAWVELRATDYPDLFETVGEEREWGLGSLKLLADYFTIEDPSSFEPDELEMNLLVDLDDEMRIRGILDRMETVTESDGKGGEREVLVITDYKTGKAPPERFADKAFFALRIYALLIRKMRGVTPDRVRLLYLKGPTALTRDIDDDQLDEMHAHLAELWTTINAAIAEDNWPVQKSALCDWCDFQSTLCPAFNTEQEITVNLEVIRAEMRAAREAVADG